MEKGEEANIDFILAHNRIQEQQQYLAPNMLFYSLEMFQSTVLVWGCFYSSVMKTCQCS